MNQGGLAESSFARNDGGGCPTGALEALKALVGTTRLATSFTRFTFFAEGPIAALRFALEGCQPSSTKTMQMMVERRLITEVRRPPDIKTRIQTYADGFG